MGNKFEGAHRPKGVFPDEANKGGTGDTGNDLRQTTGGGDFADLDRTITNYSLFLSETNVLQGPSTVTRKISPQRDGGFLCVETRLLTNLLTSRPEIFNSEFRGGANWSFTGPEVGGGSLH